MHIFQHMKEIAGITEFVIVISDQFEEMIVQFNGLSGVKDRGMGVTDKITGNHFVIYIFQNAFQVGLGSLFDPSV